MTTTPAARRSVAEQQRLEAAFTEMFEQQIVFNRVLGLKVVSLAPSDVRLSFEMRPELIGHFLHQRLHGGAISATLDATGALALMVAIAERHPADDAQQVLQRFARMGTIDLRTDFLRPGLAARYVAQAEVTRLGGRVGSTQMRLVDDAGQLIATGSGSYIVS